VADGSNGVFAAVPSKPITVNGEKRFWNQVAFTSNEIRERFLGELLEDYHRWRKNEAGHPPPEAKASGAEDAEEGPPF
jgi:DNA-binding cell septation regulator SpoVG